MLPSFVMDASAIGGNDMSVLMNLERRSHVNFTVLLTNEDSWYVAKCIDNNVASQGKTIEEALTNLREALELFYEDADEAITRHVPARAFLTTLEVAVL
jgi:predicted RNase H-like HicB family nuclease